MIKYISSKDSAVGERKLADTIISHLNRGERVVWTLPGGSNVPISVSVLKKVREKIKEDALSNLVIMQVDERYGPVGHKDSNWTQLLALNFPVQNILTHPLLRGLSLEETAKAYSKIVIEEFGKANYIVGQFGMGPDGHIAGLFPNSSGFLSAEAVCGYDHEGTFTRLSLTVPYLSKINEAFVFVFGESKRSAIIRLKKGNESVENLPASIFNLIDTVNFYSDQV